MNKIKKGDYVLLYLNQRKTYMVRAEQGETFHTHKGFVSFDDLIGREYGCKTLSNLNAEFVALRPLLRDYIFKSTRRTQITYPKDVALIVMFSGVGPGSRVVEAGTGTGALTTALAHYVKPSGRVFSYEIREEFIKTARKNLRRAGLQGYVEFKNKDVISGIDETEVDSVILDLATPWLVVPSAMEALKLCGTLASFSPTVSQVVNTVEALKENGFVDIETVECLVRRMKTERGKTRPQTLMTGHTGYITISRKAKKRCS